MTQAKMTQAKTAASIAQKDQFSARDHLYLIDAPGYIYRAYHALPPLTRASDGFPVGALSGFCAMLHKLLTEIQAGEQKGENASHIAAVFDAPGPTFRHALYADYKANRLAMPDELRQQMPLARTAAAAFSLPVIEAQGLEADDLIASYAVHAAKAGARVSIVSSDKDLMQLVGARVRMLDRMKGRIIGPAEVEDYFGVPPARVVDVQALSGDSSDNIPGAPGIGVKTAAQLISQYGDLASLLARAHEIPQPKKRETLTSMTAQILLSRDLAQLKQDCPLPLPAAGLAFRPPQLEQVLPFLQTMEFRTLTGRIAKALGGAVPEAASAAQPAAARNWQAGETPADAAAFWLHRCRETPYAGEQCALITSAAALRDWCAKARAAGLLAIDTETTSLDPMRAELVGIALSCAAGEAAYLPLAHEKDGTRQLEQMPIAQAQKLLQPILQDQAIMKIAHNAKYDFHVLARAGFGAMTPLSDTMLMSHALDGGRARHGLSALAERHFGHSASEYKDITGQGRGRIPFAQTAIRAAAAYAGEDAEICLRLYYYAAARLAAESKMHLYHFFDAPLLPVLADMERAGIALDGASLKSLAADLAARREEAERAIHQLAGVEFNIGSPKQMAEILFTRLGLEGGRKTKTGQWSTRAGFLEELAAKGVDIAASILQWRQLDKLKSTYADALPSYIHPETKRVHTCYAMTAAFTGRLASSDPNLQNIPIRTAEGRLIRRAFIAGKNKTLISADYSQIELRLLAIIADVADLKAVFARGGDIHRATAAEIFAVAEKDVSASQRRRAKAVNFGLIYGQSAWGLARQLRIPQAEARDYITAYFRRYPEIAAYMEKMKEQARARGYVDTLFGRRCHLPHAQHYASQAERGHAERAAINAPVQGTAADLIRRAMIKMPAALKAARLKTIMLLQVHDELIFEAPKAESKKAAHIIKQVMEGAAEPFITLSVPPEVDIGFGDNWDVAH